MRIQANKTNARKLPSTRVSIGTSNTEVWEAFDELSFFRAFEKDIDSASNCILLQSPYVTQRRAERWYPFFRHAIERGVRICLFIREEEHWQRRNYLGLPPDTVLKLQQFEHIISTLHSLGAHINLREKIHEKLVVFDSEILWDGSLNILSHRDTFERMTRSLNRTKALSAAARHRLDTCGTCWQSSVYEQFTSRQAEAILTAFAHQLSNKRTHVKLSQRRLAQLVGTDQSLISKFENGACPINSESLIRIAGTLNHEFVLVPRMLVPAVEELLNHHLQKHRNSLSIRDK